MNLIKVKMLSDTRWTNTELKKGMVLKIKEDIAKRWIRQGIATKIEKDTKK